MPTNVYTELGGAMAKNVKLQVFLEPTTYLELVNEARNVGITAKTDSELIRKILYRFFQDLPMLTLQVESLKKACAEKNVIIEKLQEAQHGKTKPGQKKAND